MRIWLIQRAEPTPIDNNGQARLMRTGIFANILALEGHEVIWWTSAYDHYNRCHRFNTDKKVNISNKYDIQYLKSRGYNKNISLARLKDNVDLAKRFRALASLEYNKPDIIVASVPSAEIALEAIRYGKKNAIPVILDVRDLWPDVLKAQAPWWAKHLVNLLLLPMTLATKKAFSSADAVIGVTDEFVKWGLKFANREISDKDRVFGMGYIKRELTESECRKGQIFWESAGLSSQDEILTVVFFGTLGHMFDLNPIIEAANILANKNAPVQFVICGDGESAASIKEKVENLSNVIMPGWIGDIEIRTLLKCADIGLAPYIDCPNFTNNIANKPAEYLSGGLPIALSFNHGALYELIEENGCGFSYQNNGLLLSNSIQLYSANRRLLEEASHNAHHVFCTHLDGDVIYRKIIEYCKSFLQND